MSSNIVNKTPYLRTSRNYPEEGRQLTVEVNKSYVDIANSVNDRIIGIFPVNNPAITGEAWTFSGAASRQQTLRQVYNIPAIAAAGGSATIPHGITNFTNFTRIWGVAIDASGNYRPLPYVSKLTGVSNVSIELFCDATNIYIQTSTGWPVNITSGQVVLEWLSNV